MRKTDSTKTRWLKISSPSEQGKEHMLALVNTIDGVEMKVVQGITYVRLPEVTERGPKKRKHKVGSFLQIASQGTITSRQEENERLYCAVMLK